MVVLYQHELTGSPPAELYDNLMRDRGYKAAEYTREVVEAVIEGSGELDTAIDAASRDWPAHRLAALERSIIRIAVFEIRLRPDIPVEVSIDEAVTLAKRYCSSEAGALVNGILSKISQSQVPEEAQDND